MKPNPEHGIVVLAIVVALLGLFVGVTCVLVAVWMVTR